MKKIFVQDKLAHSLIIHDWLKLLNKIVLISLLNVGEFGRNDLETVGMAMAVKIKAITVELQVVNDQLLLILRCLLLRGVPLLDVLEVSSNEHGLVFVADLILFRLDLVCLEDAFTDFGSIINLLT